MRAGGYRAKRRDPQAQGEGEEQQLPKLYRYSPFIIFTHKSKGKKKNE